MIDSTFYRLVALIGRRDFLTDVEKSATAAISTLPGRRSCDEVAARFAPLALEAARGEVIPVSRQTLSMRVAFESPGYTDHPLM